MDEFTKADLQIYNVCELRNGQTYVILWAAEVVLMNVATGSFLLFSMYDYAMLYRGNEIFDIMKVKAFPFWFDAFRSTGMLLDYSAVDFEWSWERANEGTPLTLDEISKLLGFRVRIKE